MLAYSGSTPSRSKIVLTGDDLQAACTVLYLESHTRLRIVRWKYVQSKDVGADIRWNIVEILSRYHKITASPRYWAAS